MASSARIDELKKKFDENPRRYFAPLANEYRKAGDIEQAIVICREYLPQQPGHMSGHIVYGQALYEARQLDEAETVFETALSLDPENLIALRHLGDIAGDSGDPTRRGAGTSACSTPIRATTRSRRCSPGSTKRPRATTSRRQPTARCGRRRRARAPAAESVDPPRSSAPVRDRRAGAAGPGRDDAARRRPRRRSPPSRIEHCRAHRREFDPTATDDIGSRPPRRPSSMPATDGRAEATRVDRVQAPATPVEQAAGSRPHSKWRPACTSPTSRRCPHSTARRRPSMRCQDSRRPASPELDEPIRSIGATCCRRMALRSLESAPPLATPIATIRCST